MKKRKFFPKKTYLAMSISAAIAFSGAGDYAFAQDEESLEEVVVTGSRIRRKDFVANSPIVTVDQSTFEETSTIGLDTILNQLPQFIPGITGAPSATPNQTANEAQQFGTGGSQFAAGGIEASAFATPGASSVNLRGLGAGRNLVLIDGRRGMPLNASMTVDLNSIPSSAVERIEIISGGASAVYGADAVAGAINFILKDDFEGLEIDTNYGLTKEGDHQEYRVSGLAGVSSADGRGNIMIGLEHSRRDEGDFNKRDWFREMRADPRLRGNALFPTDTYIGGLDGGLSPVFPVSPAMRTALDTVFPDSAGEVSPFFGFLSVNRSDGTVYSGAGFFGLNFERDGSEKYNGPFDVNGFPKRKLDPLGGISENQETNWISVPLERYSMFAKAKYDITDNITAKAHLTFAKTNTETSNQFSPANGSWGIWIPKGPGLWPDSLVDPSAITYAADGSIASWDPNATTDPRYISGGAFGLNCAPTGGCTASEVFPLPPEVALIAAASSTPDSIRVSRVLDFLGERRTITNTTNYQFNIGLEGEFENGYYWDLNISHGQNESITQLNNFASVERLRAVATSPNFGRGFVDTGNDLGAGWGAGTGTCTTGLPLFRDFPISRDCAEAIRASLSQIGRMTQNTIEANIGGDLFELPAGSLKFAVGADWRQNEYDYGSSDNNLPINFRSQTVGLYPNDETIGEISVYEVYGEVLVPVVADGPDGMRNLNLEIGGRASNYYDTNSGIVTTLKALADWMPLDWMRLRGGYQRATRAPNINELFTGRARTVWNLGSSHGDVCSLHNFESTLSATTMPDGAETPISTAAQAAHTRAMCEQMMGVTAAAYYNVPLADQPDPGGSGQVWVTGNPEVEPETANTFTAGLVITSPFMENPWLRGAQLAVDWYQIELDDMISQISPDTIYNRCFNINLNPTGDINSLYCSKIQRDPNTGGSLATDVTYNNEVTSKLQGIDINLSWNAQLSDLGIDMIPGGVGLNMLTTVPLLKETQATVDDELIDWVGFQSGGGCPQGISCTTYNYQIFTTVNYFHGPYSLSLRWQHYPTIEAGAKATNPDSTQFGVHESYNVFALTGSYRMNDTVTVMAGIENLFDTDPPLAGGDPDNANWPIPPVYSGGGIYDVRGQRFFVSAKFSF